MLIFAVTVGQTVGPLRQARCLPPAASTPFSILPQRCRSSCSSLRQPQIEDLTAGISVQIRRQLEVADLVSSAAPHDAPRKLLQL